MTASKAISLDKSGEWVPGWHGSGALLGAFGDELTFRHCRTGALKTQTIAAGFILRFRIEPGRYPDPWSHLGARASVGSRVTLRAVHRAARNGMEEVEL